MRAGGRRATRRGRSVEGLAERLEPRVLLAAHLVRDVNTTPGTVSFLGNITPVGSVAHFMEHDGADGVELWSTDGTASGTQLIKDINPGPGGSYPGGFTTIFGITYFAATDGTSGSELWRTDGTADGTWRVKDINPGRADSNPGDFAVSGSMLYFFADDGVHGRELWRSDGTEDGTVLVADIRPGATGQSVTNLRRMVATSSGALVFYANNGTSTGVYTSDGEVGNYTLLKVPSTPPASSLIASGNYAYFADSLGYVWGSDGTAAGTIAIDSTNSLANQFLDANGVLFYVRGSNLVRRIDGTSVTSVSGSYRNASSLINVDGTVYFGATDFVTGHPQLWTCPAFTSSGSMVTNNVSVVGGAGVNGTLYFVAGTSTTGYTLYTSDGTTFGTTAVKLVNSGGTLAAPSSFRALGNQLLFINTDRVTGTEMWVSDGTSGGTQVLRDIYPGTETSQPLVWQTTLPHQVLFIANDGVTGSELWASDGTAAGTLQLKDIGPGATGGGIQFLRAIGNVAYFSAADATAGRELWVTDGTPAGTFRLADINPGTGSSFPSEFTPFNGWVYFAASDGVHGDELWRTDGTPGSAQMVADINPGSGDSNPTGFTVMNGILYFVASTPATGAELWRSDGTAAGTQLVKDIYPGSSDSSIASLTNINGTLYFAATASSAAGSEPWKSDGTAAGTVMIKDLSTQFAHGSAPASFTAFNGAVYFTAADDTAGRELWKTDGTANGTVRVVDLNPGTASSSPGSLTVLNGRLYFIADDGTHRGKLWSTLGTADTTAPVNPNSPASITWLSAIGGRLFMVADDGAGTGFELWTSDGTAAGTVMVQDVWPDVWQGTSQPLVGLNGDVYFSGNDGISGGELYRLPDTFAPFVWNSHFAATEAGTETLQFNLNEPVTGLSAANLSLVNITTGIPVSPGAVTFSLDSTGTVATFAFAALPAGSYRAVLFASGVVDRAGNALAADVTMNFATSTLAGSVFNDLNHNGVRDGGEAGVSGRTIFVDSNNNGSLDVGEITTTTDSAGSYLFPYVPPGAATVREVVPVGWARTAPLASSLRVSVVLAQAAVGPVFGDVQVSTVTMNFNYLLTLAQHYGQQGTFAYGDVNGDDTVNFSDLLLLAQNYGHTLAVAAAGQDSVSDPLTAIRLKRRNVAW